MFVRPVRHFAGCAFVGARRPDAGPRPLFVWNCAINNNKARKEVLPELVPLSKGYFCRGCARIGKTQLRASAGHF